LRKTCLGELLPDHRQVGAGAGEAAPDPVLILAGGRHHVDELEHRGVELEREVACGQQRARAVLARNLRRQALDRRQVDELAVDAQRRHDLGQQAVAVRLMRRPRLAQRRAAHRRLDADEERQEVGAAAVGRRAVARARLAEEGQVLREGEVAGHADLLPAGDAHAVHAADDGLVAVQDGRDHVVEQAHVLPVLLRVPGVILRVLLRVPAGAERLVPGAGDKAFTPRSTEARRKARISALTMSVV